LGFCRRRRGFLRSHAVHQPRPVVANIFLYIHATLVGSRRSLCTEEGGGGGDSPTDRRQPLRQPEAAEPALVRRGASVVYAGRTLGAVPPVEVVCRPHLVVFRLAASHLVDDQKTRQCKSRENTSLCKREITLHSLF
jgi:hypothetical protein